MAAIFEEIAKLGKEKEIDYVGLLASGARPEDVLEFLKQYNPPPSGPISGFFAGLKRGIVAPIRQISGAVEAIPVVGKIAEPVRQGLTSFAGPEYYSTQPSTATRVGQTIGETLGFLAGLVPLAALAVKAGVPAALAVPTVLGIGGLGETYTSIPKEYRQEHPIETYARSLAGGLGSAAVGAIPMSHIARGALGKIAPAVATRPIVGSAISEAVATPAMFTGLELAISPWTKVGIPLPQAYGQAIEEALTHLYEGGIPEAIAGALLGAGRGVFGLRKARAIPQQQPPAAAEPSPPTAPVSEPVSVPSPVPSQEQRAAVAVKALPEEQGKQVTPPIISPPEKGKKEVVKEPAAPLPAEPAKPVETEKVKKSEIPVESKPVTASEISSDWIFKGDTVSLKKESGFEGTPEEVIYKTTLFRELGRFLESLDEKDLHGDFAVRYVDISRSPSGKSGWIEREGTSQLSKENKDLLAKLSRMDMGGDIPGGKIVYNIYSFFKDALGFSKDLSAEEKTKIKNRAAELTGMFFEHGNRRVISVLSEIKKKELSEPVEPAPVSSDQTITLQTVRDWGDSIVEKVREHLSSEQKEIREAESPKEVWLSDKVFLSTLADAVRGKFGFSNTDRIDAEIDRIAARSFVPPISAPDVKELGKAGIAILEGKGKDEVPDIFLETGGFSKQRDFYTILFGEDAGSVLVNAIQRFLKDLRTGKVKPYYSGISRPMIEFLATELKGVDEVAAMIDTIGLDRTKAFFHTINEALQTPETILKSYVDIPEKGESGIPVSSIQKFLEFQEERLSELKSAYKDARTESEKAELQSRISLAETDVKSLKDFVASLSEAEHPKKVVTPSDLDEAIASTNKNLASLEDTYRKLEEERMALSAYRQGLLGDISEISKSFNSGEARSVAKAIAANLEKELNAATSELAEISKLKQDLQNSTTSYLSEIKDILLKMREFKNVLTEEERRALPGGSEEGYRNFLEDYINKHTFYSQVISGLENKVRFLSEEFDVINKLATGEIGKELLIDRLNKRVAEVDKRIVSIDKELINLNKQILLGESRYDWLNRLREVGTLALKPEKEYKTVLTQALAQTIVNHPDIFLRTVFSENFFGRIPAKKGEDQVARRDMISNILSSIRATSDAYKHEKIVKPVMEKATELYNSLLQAKTGSVNPEMVKEFQERLSSFLDDPTSSDYTPQVFFIPFEKTYLESGDVSGGKYILVVPEIGPTAAKYAKEVEAGSLPPELSLHLEKIGRGHKLVMVLDSEGKIDNTPLFSLINQSLRNLIPGLRIERGKESAYTPLLQNLAEDIDRVSRIKGNVIPSLHAEYILSDPAKYFFAKVVDGMLDWERVKETESRDNYLLAGFRSATEAAKSDPKFIGTVPGLYQMTRSILAKALTSDMDIKLTTSEDPLIVALKQKYGAPFYGASMFLADKKNLILVVDLMETPKDFVVSFGHELFHLVTPNLSPTDLRLLTKKYGNLEKVAEAFGEYVYGKYEPPSFEKRVFHSMLKLWERIVNIFRGLGFVSAEDLFDSIIAGEKSIQRPDSIGLAHFVKAQEIASKNDPNYSNTEWTVAFRSAWSKAKEIEQDLFNKIGDFVKTYAGRTELPTVAQGIPSIRPKSIASHVLEFLRNNFTLPLHEPFQRKVLDMVKEAQGRVSEVLIPKYEVVRTAFLSFSPELREKANLIRIMADAEGVYPGNLDNFLSKLNVTATAAEKEQLRAFFSNYKDFTDSVMFQLFDQTLSKLSAAYMRILSDVANSGQIDSNTAIKMAVAVEGFYKDVRNNLLRVYPFTIDSEGKRVVLDEGKRDSYINSYEDLKATAERLLSSAGAKEGVIVYHLNTLDRLIGEPVAKMYETIKELDNGFYSPRVRNDGKYEVRVWAKVIDPKSVQSGTLKYTYVELEYFDSSKKANDVKQRAEIHKILQDRLKAYENYKPLVIDSMEVYNSNKSFSKFLRDQNVSADIVIFTGRKAPKEYLTLYKLTPSEALDFIRDLALRTDDPETRTKIEQELPQALTALYADINYALARKLHRRTLPPQAGKYAISGYKTDFLEVMDNYTIRMLGHLTNSGFLADYFYQSNLPSVKALFAEHPEAKELVSKYIEMLTAPNSRVANIVYKLRALAALSFLGLRLTSAIMNYSNIFLTFIPEYISIVRNNPPSSLARPPMFIDLLTRKEERSPLTVVEAFKGYPEAIKEVKDGFRDVSRFLKEGIITKDLRINWEKVEKPEDRYILQAVQKLIYENVIESSLVHTLRTEGMDLFGKTLNAVFDKGMWLFRNAERHARLASAVTLLKELYHQGWPVEEAARITSAIIDNTFFRYDRLNRFWWNNPSKAFGAILSMPTTLKGFSINYLNTLLNWVDVKDYGKVALSLAFAFTLGGLSGGIPLLDDLLDIVERASHIPVRGKVQAWLKDSTSEGFASFLIKGVPSIIPYLGIDLSTTVRTELPFIPKSLSVSGFVDAFLGVQKAMFERWEKGVSLLSDGDYVAALSFLAPLGIGLPVQALMLSTEGLVTKYGTKVIEPETGEQFKLTPTEAILRAMGARPIRLANIQDARFFGMRISNWFSEERKKIYRKFREDEDLTDLWKDILDYNERALQYEGIPLISSQSLRKGIAEKPERPLMIAASL